MVKQSKLTAPEQKLYDEVAKDEFLRCLAVVDRDTFEGCARHAFDAAEAFIAERRVRMSVGRPKQR